MSNGRYKTLLIVMAVLIVLSACSGNEMIFGEGEDVGNEMETEHSDASPPAELFGNSLRGGLIYDSWWRVLGNNPPTQDHPLWATQDTNTRTGGDTWRCKECHGWDYKGADGAYGSGSHFTGFPGVIQLAGEEPGIILQALKGSTNPDHDFSLVMNEQALTDLALFISQDMIDFSHLVSEDKAAKNEDLQTGEQLFLETCVHCHGQDGALLNFGTAQEPEYLGDLASDNPWEVLHKARFGQPGVERMPSVIDASWTLEEQGALLAYLQTLEPNSNLIPLGGLLYDNWWNAIGVDATAEDHPLWAAQDSNSRTGGDTWRCKECHGWDYKGADGAYGSGSHYTGFPGIFGAAGSSSTDLTGWLDGSTNPDHDFSSFLDEESMSALVSFIQRGTVNMSDYINDEDKSAIGDAAAGQPLFNTSCAPCHGLDGTSINFGDSVEPVYLGDLAWENPWETVHKAANGQPGSMMPSGLALGWSWEDIANVLAYLQTLTE